MCLNDIRAEEIPRTSSLYIAVNERTKKKTHIDCECTHAFAVPTPSQLECCFFCCVTKRKKQKSTLTSEEREPLSRLSVGHIFVMI